MAIFRISPEVIRRMNMTPEEAHLEMRENSFNQLRKDYWFWRRLATFLLILCLVLVTMFISLLKSI